ncbi:LPS export ABC transporter periplasmic protein LptC [Verrucomicrobiota bacterium sgz303538]
MRSSRKLAILAACLGLITGGHTFAAKKEDKPKEKTEKTDKNEKGKEKDKDKRSGKKKGDKKDASAEEQEKGKLSVPILKGHDAYGLKIPYFNPDGKLQMIFNIGRASRLDENRVSMDDMELETYDDQGQPEMNIELPTSVLDLNTKVITTDTNVTIKRSDFEITGHSMEFNTETRQGKLSGSVRMLIYDLGEEAAAPKKDETTTQ